MQAKDVYPHLKVRNLNDPNILLVSSVTLDALNFL